MSYNTGLADGLQCKNYEKHCGGLPSGWRRKASKERLPTVVIALAFANIVTFYL